MGITVEFESIVIFCMASVTVFLGSFFSRKNYLLLTDSGDVEDVTVSLKMALMFPLVSSLMLLAFFYFFDIFSMIILLLVVVYSVIAVNFFLSSLMSLQKHKFCATQSVRLPYFGDCSVREAGCTAISISLALLWLFTVIAISACILALSFMHLPSIKVASFLLLSLFVYDIFWVFYSERFFGMNVMATVATQAAPNVASSLAEKFGFTQIVKEIQLPMKIIFGRHILGLGDIVLPGLLVSFASKYDSVKKAAPSSLSYHQTTFLGYCAGLICAMMAVNIFKVPQPALLYLVPSTLGALIALAWKRNDLKQMWVGLPSPFQLPDSL